MNVLHRLLFLTLSLLPLLGFSQIVDDFSDGNFTANPTWSGDNIKFEVTPGNQLHLDAPAITDEAYLSAPNQAINNAQWDFYVELDFNPSGSNLAKVFLVSNQTVLTNPVNGYFVMIGNTTDEISLYRQDGSVVTKIIDGVDDRVDVSLVTARIRVTRDDMGNWELLSDTAGTTNYFSEGTVFDDTYIQSSYFGMFCDYTATRSDKFYFDDVSVTGQAFVDLVPPTVTAVNVVSDTELDVQFSEVVQTVSTQALGNYSANNGLGNPIAANIDVVDSSLVHLTFGTAFGAGISNTLTISNVQDAAGNSMAITTETFIYFVAVTPNFKDIVINEILSDPSPVVGLPEAEFVELYNNSSAPQNLEGWTFSDPTSTGVIASFVLLPNEYVILCPAADVGSFTSFGDVIGLSSWPALNNSGDSLILADSSGSAIDVVDYSPDWFNDAFKEAGGWSLELINPTNPCSGSGNWSGSENSIGGTPGTENSIYDVAPDTVAPNLERITIVADTLIIAYFDEGMDSADLANATFSFDNGITITAFEPQAPEFASVRLFLSNSLDSSIIYQLQIQGATDCAGNLLATNALTFGIGTNPLAQEIVFNELFPDPDAAIGSLPAGEFIELYNRTNKLIRLDGYSLSDATSSATLEDALIQPNGFLILTPADYEAAYSNLGPTAVVSGFPSLNNSSDLFTLSAPNGAVVDQVNYSDTWYRDNEKSNGGWTIERINPEDLCSSANGWRASLDVSGGTPGTTNSIFDPQAGLGAPELIAVQTLGESQLELVFNKTMDSLSLTTGSYSLSDDTTIDSVKAIGPNFNTVQLFLTTPLARAQVLTVSVSSVKSCIGESIGLSNFIQFALANPGDIVINELLYDPRETGSDFVELHNRVNYPINLQGWGLGSYDSNDSLQVDIISDTALLLEIDGYIVLNEDNDNVLFEYPQSVAENFIEIDLPTYANSNGSVILVNNLGEIVEQFDYDEEQQFALLRDNEGVSLERIDPSRPATDRTNWHSAAEDAGWATPGFVNSQFGQTDAGTNEISVAPEVFSPDNDGFDDVVNISYQFSDPGFVANVTIYDSKGRLVRELLNNELLGIEGTFSWDGIGDSNEKARVGIHVIFIEVFDLEGNVKQFKEPCVVATRF